MLRKLCIFFFSACLLPLFAGCSTNPATGEQQFTALMSPSQELQVGAQEHEKVARLYNVDTADPSLKAYIDRIGQKVATHTERQDVGYKFFVLDSPDVNAFALPGGFVYVSRGLITQANSEAELAAVIAHEIGHITARHSAERYSHGVLSKLGAIALSAALDDPSASQVLDVGSELYIKSYSREQEHQADELGIRYLHRAGYDTTAMASFLTNLENHTALQSRLAGRGQGGGFNYFSTHPRTGDRISETVSIARGYPKGGVSNRDAYLNEIDGITYGDSAWQGFTRGRDFYHPQMGFTFYVPQGFFLTNQPSRIVSTHPSGAVIVFDGAPNRQKLDAQTYLTNVWMQGKVPGNPERIRVNGMDAATAAFDGEVNNRRVNIRIVAVEWSPEMFFRFQLAIPHGADSAMVDDLKKVTYSLRPMTAQEKNTVQPYRVKVVTAQGGDSVSSMAARMPYENMKTERFLVLNNLQTGATIQPGRRYKIITE